MAGVSTHLLSNKHRKVDKHRGWPPGPWLLGALLDGLAVSHMFPAFGGPLVVLMKLELGAREMVQ